MFSVMLLVWLRLVEAEPSESPPKFVKERLGGPQLMGSCVVPVIPSSAAMFWLYAKKGAFLAMLRLKFQVRLLLKRGLKLWLHPALLLRPDPSAVSRKPNRVGLLPLLFW